MAYDTFRFKRRRLTENVKLQEGIKYYEKPFHSNSLSKPYHSLHRNECFAMLFLRVDKDSESIDVHDSLKELWEMYCELKKGKVRDLPGQHVPTGGLSSLVGYGPNIFTTRGIRKRIPRDFIDRQFLSPSPGRPILEGSGIKYIDDTPENLGKTEDIVVQFTFLRTVQ